MFPATCTLPTVANGGYNAYSAGETVDENIDCQVTCNSNYRPIAHFITCIGPESLDIQPSCIGKYHGVSSKFHIYLDIVLIDATLKLFIF